jgi:hypothetical protein
MVNMDFCVLGLILTRPKFNNTRIGVWCGTELSGIWCNSSDWHIFAQVRMVWVEQVL